MTSDFKATKLRYAELRRFTSRSRRMAHGPLRPMSQFNIFIDRDRNGTDDFQIVNTATADAAGNLFDVFVSARRPAPFTGGLTVDSFLNNIAPCGPRNGGLQHQHDGHSGQRFGARFDHGECEVQLSHPDDESWLRWRHRYSHNSHVRRCQSRLRSDWWSYRSAALSDLNGASIPVNYNKANYVANGSQGLLLLHHHNAFGAHDQILSAQDPTATTVTVDAASGVYSDPTTLRATVSPSTYLDQTISGNVQFSVDGNPVGAAVAVNSSGVATTSYTVDCCRWSAHNYSSVHQH